jgi:UDP-3-O-[3-hydroxymyristoyl] glucosamine N-acyltransferase
VSAGSIERESGGEGDIVLTAALVAETVGGTLIGDGSIGLRRIAPLDRAAADALSFFASAKYAAAFAESRAGAVLVSPELADTPGAPDGGARIVVAKPQEALLMLLPRFHRPAVSVPGVHPTAVLGRGVRYGADVAIGPYAIIGAGARLGDRAVIGPHCVVGDGVEVGPDVHLYPNVTLYSGTRLGARVTVHAGARIGSDGFGYVQRDGEHLKIPHVGRCLIEDDVEIGANTTIDRGSIDDTVVGAGTKIDNLVQIAHNVRIGKVCLIMAQVGIAGSVHVEDGAMLLGQVGVSGHRTIGKGARLAAQAGVFGDIPAGETWSGYPARPHKEALRAQAALFKLPSLLRRIERLLDKTD